MNPSFLRIRAISPLIFEAGTATDSWRACCAFRIRVSMSAMGSVIDMNGSLLPARLHDAGELAGQSELPEADAAQAELPDVGAWPPAKVTATVRLYLVLRRPPRLHDLGNFGHVYSLRSGTACPSTGGGAAPLRRCGPSSRWSLACRAACRCCRSRS